MRRRLHPTPRRVAVLLSATVGIGVGVAYAASLTVGSWHLWAGSQTLSKATCTLSGSAVANDTYVDQANANTNYGTATTMLVKPDTNAKQWALIHFDISSCTIPSTGGADTATLKLYMNNAPNQNRTLTVTPVLTAFTATTVTWTQAQSLSYGSTTTTFTTGTTDGVTVSIPVTINVDALIKNSSAIYGWRISDGGSSASNDQTSFNTLNASSNLPQLVINYEK
jgi:hypothetical protein